MAIEVSKRKKTTKTISGINSFFQITLFLFFVVGIVYFGVFLLYQSSEKRGLEIEEEIQKKLDEVPDREEIEEKIMKYFNLINDFKLVESSRFLSSAFFSPFEQAIHPEVEVFNANVILNSGKINFSGKAKNIITVSEQFKGLKNIEYVKSVSLSGLSIEIDETTEQSTKRSAVDFNFEIEIDTEVLKNIALQEAKKNNGDNEEKNDENATETTTSFELARDYWLKIRIEEGGLKSYKELEDYLIRYGSEGKIEEMEKAQDEIGGMPEEVRSTIAKTTGGPPLSEIESITGETEENKVILFIKTKDRKIEGTIIMALENEEWKIDFEEWKNNI